MPPVTPRMMQARREPNCHALTLERKYYSVDGSFVKRSLRPSEWQHNEMNGSLHIPRFGVERILNEGAALRYIAEHTDIPVPKLYACFEDDEAAYLVMEYVQGVELADLQPKQRTKVEKEVERHLETLRGLTSKNWGGPTGIVLPPYRLMKRRFRPTWQMKQREIADLVFCHGDLSAHNIIVDPITLNIKAIIDWEYAGFFPQEFEGMFFRRPGPSIALEGETDDTTHLLAILDDNVKPL